MFSVAEGGESCLTSGDRREPEDSDVYITSSPRSAKPSEGEEESWGVYRFPRVPFSHPRLSMIRRLRRRLHNKPAYEVQELYRNFTYS